MPPENTTTLLDTLPPDTRHALDNIIDLGTQDDHQKIGTDIIKDPTGNDIKLATSKENKPPRILRPYQNEAVAAAMKEITTRSHNNPHRGRHTAIVLPTGAGKSTVAAQVIIENVKLGKRVIVIAHRVKLVKTIGEVVTELAVNQNIIHETITNTQKRCSLFDPIFFNPYNMVFHAASSNNLLDIPPEVRVIVTTIGVLLSAKSSQTNKGRHTIPTPDIDTVIIDECHHVEAQNYHSALAWLGANIDPRKGFLPPNKPPKNKPYLDIIGFTATFRREQPGESLLTVFDSVAYHKDIRWAIKQGYLIPPRSIVVALTELNILSQVKVKTLDSYTDFNKKDLAEVMLKANTQIVQAIKDHIPTTKSIVFCVDKKHTLTLTESLREAGFKVAMITGETTETNREKIFDHYQNGTGDNRIDIITTVDVLTEGVDLPICGAVVIARPTKSRNLYTQMVGRALRPYGDKDEAIVIDFAPTVGRDLVLKASTVLPEAKMEKDPKSGEEKEKAILLKPQDNPWNYKQDNAVTANQLIFHAHDNIPYGGWNTITIANTIIYFQILTHYQPSTTPGEYGRDRGCIYAAIPTPHDPTKFAITKTLLEKATVKNTTYLDTGFSWQNLDNNTINYSRASLASLVHTIGYLNKGITEMVASDPIWKKWPWYPPETITLNNLGDDDSDDDETGIKPAPVSEPNTPKFVLPNDNIISLGYQWKNTSKTRVPYWYAKKNFGEMITENALKAIIPVAPKKYNNNTDNSN